MIRKLYTTMMMLAAALLLSTCTESDDWMSGSGVPDGYVAINFTADTPAMTEVQTRSVDPDGGGITSMVLFCFDLYGIFITTVEATVTGDTETNSMTGSFSAVVPDNIRHIHFVGNQNISQFSSDKFDNDLFIGKTEAEVMSVLEGTSGRMIYWAYFGCDESEANRTKDISEQMKEKLTPQGGTEPKLTFVRNHALVTLNVVGDAFDDTDYMAEGNFIPTGFMVVNTYAHGTVAPYHPRRGYHFDWKGVDEDGLPLNDFVTLPADLTKESGITEVTNNMARFIYDSDNSFDDPVDVIIRGHKKGENANADKYYRISIMDRETGEMIPIVRNHNYIINIEGELSYPQLTFADALEAPATNNVWVTIEEDVKEVQNKDYILSVEETMYIFPARENSYTLTAEERLTYMIESARSGITIDTYDAAQITFTGNAISDISSTFRAENDNGAEVASGTKGKGYMSLSLNGLKAADTSTDRLESTITIKKGVLQRKIKVIIIKQLDFEEVWVGTDIYGDVEIVTENGVTKRKNPEHVTVMFNIPEDTPEELFPMRVLLAVKDLDVRSSSGLPLSMVYKGNDEFGENEYEYIDITKEDDPTTPDVDERLTVFAPDYKYVHIATAPGVQRVYFENILSHSTTTTNHVGVLAVETAHFNSEVRQYRFTDPEDYRAIVVADLNSYNVSGTGSAYASSDDVYYRLVPQKINAEVHFDINLYEGLYDAETETNNTPINAGPQDEFLIYTQYLKHEWNSEFQDMNYFPKKSEDFYNGNNTAHMGGRFILFKPRPDKLVKTGDDIGKYSMYMYTTQPKSQDVIRIATPPKGLPAVLDGSDLVDKIPGLEQDPTYDGVAYNYYNDNDASGNYAGHSYRSITFELANYNPFRFAATLKADNVDGSGTDVLYGDNEDDKVVPDEPVRQYDASDNPVKDKYGNEIFICNDTTSEKVTDVSLTYQLGQTVELSFDVTSFQGTDGNSADPFGTEFEIYIYAPMLTMNLANNTGLTKDDFYYDEVNKRFVYVVDADRNTERGKFKGSTVKRRDPAIVNGSAVNQTGERKTLVFQTDAIVSAGDIVLSSNQNQVVFFSKTFRIENTPIKGSIKYDDGSGAKSVESGQFVAFELVENGTRIGQVTITKDGEYELRLRKEYRYDWNSENVAFRANIGGVVYEMSTYTKEVTDEDGDTSEETEPLDLSYLIKNTEIILKPQVVVE